MGSPGLYPEGPFHGRYDDPARPPQSPRSVKPTNTLAGTFNDETRSVAPELAQVSLDEAYRLLSDVAQRPAS